MSIAMKWLSEARAEQLERAAESEVRLEGHLARAAGLSKRSREFSEAPLGNEHCLWFLTRTLAREWGLDYDQLVERGRETRPG
ncbi:MAG: hypothetical protein LC777_08970 [Actinobacteria bacterium]|nr:hypothetical protein [Actinomycetota bacterium]